LTVSWVIDFGIVNPNSSEADFVLVFHPISTFIYVLFTGGAAVAPVTGGDTVLSPLPLDMLPYRIVSM
jgi:hypothetical protein